MTGFVAIVGGGPGDPGLITVRGLQLVKTADVIVYDRLAPREVLSEAKPGAELVYAGKERGRHAMTQEEINRLLAEKAMEGRVVVRLKGGDPLTFGRGEEECAYLIDRGIPCTIVPGVPSFVAAAAYAGIPLAGRQYASSFAVTTGTRAQGSPGRSDLRAIASAVDAVVVLMAAHRAGEVLREIASVRGPDFPAAIVVSASTPQQRVYTGTALSLAEAHPSVDPPAVIIAGPQVRWREEYWLRRPPAPRYY
ncbi:uroporphyrinogen-III C-methyltransferase [Stetteria hydrogenophila]